MSTLADLYRQQRAAQSGSRIYKPPATQKASLEIYATRVYGGLSDYQRPREAAPDNRSEEAKRRAAESPWGRAAKAMAEDTVTPERWAEHRRVMDQQVGTNRGLLGQADRAAYLEQQRARPFGRVEANGHLGSEAAPGHTTVPRIYAAQIQADETRQRVAAFRASSSGEGWEE